MRLQPHPNRRLPIALIASAALAHVAAPAAAQVTTGPDEDVAAIASLIEAVEAANNAGDVEAWVALFAEDAVYMPPGVPAVTTRPELVEIARAGFMNDAAIEIEPLEIHVLGDWAFARSNVGGTITLDGSGAVVTIDVKQLVIYHREAAGWRIARLINNANG